MTTPAVLAVELLAEDAHGQVGLSVEQPGAVARAASASMARHWSSRPATSRRSSSAEAPSAAVRTISPWPGGRTSSMILRSRRRSLSPRRLEIPKALLLGTSTAKRPGSETSWVSRAPLAPIGFFVTWQRMVWPGRSTSSIRGWEP